MLTLPQYVGHAFVLTNAFRFGNAGVDFFFTLSGFIIFYVHQKDINRPERLANFVRRRVSRIYPMYWFVTAFLIVLLIAKSDWSELQPLHVIGSVLLLPTSTDPILGVGWTLVHEVLFYTVFAIAIFSRSAGIFLGLIWLALITLGSVDTHAPDILAFISSPYHYEFAFGILAAAAARRFDWRFGYVLAVVGLIGFALSAIAVNEMLMPAIGTMARFPFGVSSALILAGIAISERRGQLTVPRWATYLGAA